MKRIFTAVIALFSIGWLAAQIVVRTETGIYFLPIASVDSVTFMSHPKRYEFFSVGADKYVAFSPGNLQCVGVKSGNYKWSFAAHQYDCIGAGNVENDALADRIDLFGWSADNTTAPWGISISKDDADYSGDFVDWGTNAIGRDAAGTWRTLSKGEWVYLFQTRPDASSKYGVARINLNADGSQYMNGLIVLPDSWTCPSGITFKSGVSTTSGGGYADYQTFTLSQWRRLEKAGAVFLPAAGARYGLSMGNVQNIGFYWSSTADDTGRACSVYSPSYLLDPQYYSSRPRGQAVRLVQDLATYTITCKATTNGSLSADKTTLIPRGDKVTITAKPDDGYALQLTVQQGTTKVTTTFLGSNTYTFTMPAGDVVVSAVYQKIKYSVSANDVVNFASGNLQYQRSTGTWSFAEHQYDYIGAGNVENDALADKIDLFGWSATNTTAPWGVSISTNKSDYSGDFVDWGENIGDGNTWRTLSGEEWGYLFDSRANAGSLYGFATVNGVKGLILLPDDWVLPSGLSFHAGKASFGNNVYTLLQWEEMESAGAVFLPGAGRRKGADYDVQGYNVYWSSTACHAKNENDPYNANFVLFYSYNVNPQYCDIRYYGRSVRLVKDL